MLQNEFKKANLRKLVIIFYTKVLQDDIVGPFFINKLGDDLAGGVWAPHLDTLTEFWASFTIGNSTYAGSPFAPHVSMAGLERKTFERWLELFFETLDSLYEPQLAIQLKERSHLIAGNFMRNLRL